MNPNELTPTQRVGQQIKSQWISGECGCPLGFVKELATELERMTAERDELYESRAKLAQDYANEREYLRAELERVQNTHSNYVRGVLEIIKERDDLKRKVERLEKSYVLQRESHEVEIYSWGQRNAQLSRQVEELNAQLKEIVSIKPSRSELAEQNSILRFRISTLEDSTKLRRRLKLAEDEISRHQPELCDEIRMERDHLRAEHTMLKAQNDSLDRELTRRDNENAELLKDKKRLERLMTLERGDLLWFHQERDKRRALDILMEDNE